MKSSCLAGFIALIATTTAGAQEKAWVQASNAHAQILMQAQAPFQPEQASFFGLPGYDDQVADLGPRVGERFRQAIGGARDELSKRLASENDANVLQDLQIMIDAAELQIEGSALGERLMLPWIDVAQLVFSGEGGLLQEETAAERRAKAPDRLRRYVGLTPDTVPIATLARQRYEERTEDASLLRPTRLEVERALANGPTYVQGIKELYAQFEITGADDALAAMERQLGEYGDWVRSSVLPAAREDTCLPAELYAYKLEQVGIDIPPQLLIQRAQLEFMETRAAMQVLAPQVAKARGLEQTDYRDVIRALKEKQLDRARIEAHYRRVLGEIDRLIAANKVVGLPGRPMKMRLASEAESAAQPAPHFLPAPLIGNKGEPGQFVLPLGNPKSADDAGGGEAYDDFNYEAVSWTLSAHEGRPGHELQFTAMVERGVSLARSLFAFNSVNVEGWALYAEAEMVPYEPLEGQLLALQFRLLRAARAVLDPMLNLGLIERERAGAVLTGDVVLSPAMTRQELDRYTFLAPGQAGSYFYGYSRIMELRMEAELALGARFDREAFNNFLLGQGLLPPKLLADSVRKEFIPFSASARPDPTPRELPRRR